MATKVRLAWSVTAGGCSALPHQNGYWAGWGSAQHQAAHVWAVGRRGYQAYVTGLPGRGLWTDLGAFRHPASARKACRLAVQAAGGA
jgi:hypothetical protein